MHLSQVRQTQWPVQLSMAYDLHSCSKAHTFFFFHFVVLQWFAFLNKGAATKTFIFLISGAGVGLSHEDRDKARRYCLKRN